MNRAAQLSRREMGRATHSGHGNARRAGLHSARRSNRISHRSGQQSAFADPGGDAPVRTRRRLPEMAQPPVLRHYLRLSQMTLGCHVTPDASLGTCTMKYSPQVNEHLARMPQMSELHPLQDDDTAQGILEDHLRLRADALRDLRDGRIHLSAGWWLAGDFRQCLHHPRLSRATGRARSAQRDHLDRFFPSDRLRRAGGGRVPGDHPDARSEWLSRSRALKAVVSERTAGLMMTNPEDTGIFNPHVEEFTRIVHEAGGLCAYDQANANGILGITRARDNGFDLCQFNLHKTFSVPHGSTGGSCGAGGVTAELAKYLPAPMVAFDGERYSWDYDRPRASARVRSFPRQRPGGACAPTPGSWPTAPRG